MTRTRRPGGKVLAGAALVGAGVASLLVTANASSHREAPMLLEDPVADMTDLYVFDTRTDDADPANDMVTLVGNWVPFEEPAGGPNFYKFGDDVLYEFAVDNDGDAVEDISYQFRFRTTIVNDETFLYNTGVIDGLNDDHFNIRQHYTVTEVRDGKRTVLAQDVPVPPVNIGPRSTPRYQDLAQAAVAQNVGNTGINVFAGQREDSFFADIGSVFDLLGLRPLNQAHLIPLPTMDGIDTFAGYNVQTIAIEVPKSRLVSEGEPVIGVWSDTYRRKVRVYQRNDGADLAHNGPWVQVSRLGNPLVNEVVIPLKDKDRFNASDPADDAQFLDYVVNPEVGELIPLLYPVLREENGGCFPDAPRNDLVSIFLTGIEGINQPANVVPSEQLRFNTDAPAGWPNGRALSDDVTDTALVAVAGAALPSQACFGEEPNSSLTDGVQSNDAPFLGFFPYAGVPFQGYESDENQAIPVEDPAP